MGFWVFSRFFLFLYAFVCVFCILAVWWRETLTMTIVLYLRLNSIFYLYLYCYVFVFFLYVFCILLWWITLAVWWRETLTMTMERRDIYCHPFWSRDKGKKNHDILTTRQYFGQKGFFTKKETSRLYWHDTSAPFKRFKWACLYRSQKMLWSSIRGCSSRAL